MTRKKYVIAAVALLTILTVFGVVSEAAPSQPKTPRQTTTRDIGSAKTLRGDTYILMCFISDSSNAWSSDEKRGMINKTREALSWMKNQALRYNVGVNFEEGVYGEDADIKLDNIAYGRGSGPGRPLDTTMVSRVMKALGWQDSLSFYNWVNQNKKSDNSLVLIFIKGTGIGYAYEYIQGVSEELFFMEGAVLYERYTNNNELASASIAHEILHLFGAWDFSRTHEQTQDREDKARQLFPNSIMLRVSNNINELSIDEVTAWLVGWKSNPEPWYEWFNPYAITS